MASKKQLKNEFIKLAKDLFDEALLFRSFAEGETVEQLDELLDELLVWTDDTIRRIHHTDAVDNPRLVRSYYRNLKAEINERVVSFDERLLKLLEAL